MNKMFTQTWNKITKNRCLLSSLTLKKKLFKINNYYKIFKYFSSW